MKIAILILAHKNLEQLRLLIDHLKVDFDVYIHINKLVKHSLPDEPGVHFIEERYAPYWGSDNTPKAMLALIKSAYINECNYFMIISGQDLPLLSNEDIKAFICKRPVNYIYHHKIPKQSWSLNGGLDRLTLFWPRQYDSNNVGGIILNSVTKPAGWIIRKLQLITGLKRKIKFEPWGGSMWLNITREAAQYIISYLDENPSFMARFRFTKLSDEILFHSILLGTGFKESNNIVNDDLRYIDWESGPQYPRILTVADLPKCVGSGKLFARKFDEKTDATIIRQILKHTKKSSLSAK